MTTGDIPGLVEMETSAQTRNYRDRRLGLWRLLQSKRDEYEKTALGHGASETVAAESAGRHVRGEVNLFVDELLTHLRKSDAILFITAAPRAWGLISERLLDTDPLVPGLLARSFPVPAWADRIDAVEKAIADDNEDWRRWLIQRLDRLGEAGLAASEHVFGAVQAVGEGLGEGLGGLGKGVGDGVGGVGRGLGTALIVGVSVLSVGAVVVGGLYLLRRR